MIQAHTRSHASDAESMLSEERAGGVDARTLTLQALSLLLAEAIARHYCPLAARLVARLVAQLRGAHVQEEAEDALLELHDRQYHAFADDSRVHVSSDDDAPVQRLLAHRFDKFKFVSEDFLARNRLQRAPRKRSGGAGGGLGGGTGRGARGGSGVRGLRAEATLRRPRSSAEERRTQPRGPIGSSPVRAQPSGRGRESAASVLSALSERSKASFRAESVVPERGRASSRAESILSGLARKKLRENNP